MPSVTYSKFVNLDELSDSNTLIFLVGPPASGKTTLSTHLHELYGYNVVRVDEIRNRMKHGLGVPIDDTQLFTEVYRQINFLLKSGASVVYDATNCYPKWRYEALRETKENRSNTICFVSTRSLQDCLTANYENNFYVPIPKLKKMYYASVTNPPTVGEGFDIVLPFFIEE